MHQKPVNHSKVVVSICMSRVKVAGQLIVDLPQGRQQGHEDCTSHRFLSFANGFFKNYRAGMISVHVTSRYNVWQVFANRCNSVWATVLALLLAEGVVGSMAKLRTWGSICMTTPSQGMWGYPWFCLLSSIVVPCCVTCLACLCFSRFPILITCLRG